VTVVKLGDHFVYQLIFTSLPKRQSGTPV